MPCYTPLKAYRAAGGSIAWDSRRGYSDRPLELRCGKCVSCRMRWARDWAIRCVHEAQMHERNWFITLTYDDVHVPKDYGLSMRDWQLFCKRLRKAAGKFRYFACGEYGSETFRPHFHMCAFGLNEISGVEKAWGAGLVHIGTLTFASAAYTAGYVAKKALGRGGSPFPGVRKEFVVMSRNPGLGAKWLERYKGDVYPSDEIIHEGQSYRPPRFYDDRLPEPELEELQARRARHQAKNAEDLTPERLRVRERVALGNLAFRQNRGL